MTWKRVATAVVLIPFVVGLVLWGSTGVVAIGIAIITLLALHEYFSLGEAIGHRAYKKWTALCALLILYVQWIATAVKWGEFGSVAQPAHIAWFLNRFFPHAEDVFFIFLIGITLLVLFAKRTLVETLPAVGISSSALVLVALPLSYAVRLRGSGLQGPRLLLFALVITWAADTTAYFVGRAVGKHPLAPALSPKKTWEGAVGSLLGSLLVALAFKKFVTVPFPHLLIMATLGNFAGQAGDLLESAYKRSAGIKDSGTLLPGHGGILDRIDALILAIPVVWYYWIIVCAPRA